MFAIMTPSPLTSTLFPYTTLFRSARAAYEEMVAIRQRLVVTSPEDVSLQEYLAGSYQTLGGLLDRKSTRLNSSHPSISYAVFCLKKKKKQGKNYANRHNTKAT